MRRVMIFLLVFVLCSTVVFGQDLSKEYFLQKRRARENMRDAWSHALQGAPSQAGLLQPGQEDYDIMYYGIDLRIDPSEETISGSVTVRAQSTISSLSEFVLDFSTELTVTAVSGDATGFDHEDDLLTISLDHAYSSGQELEVVVHYHGHPLSIGGLGLNFGQHGGSPTIHTISCPYHAYLWMPCKDYPGDKANTVDMDITVPGNLVVASNGVLRGVEDHGDGWKTYSWHEGYPISTYLMCVTIGNYVTIEDTYNSLTGKELDIINYVYPSNLASATEDFNVIPGALDIYSDWYGEYPFIEEKYGVADCAMYYAGMEHQTLTTIHTNYITGDHENDDLFVHELSHMWWGDCVTVESWHHCWLNEGFATFSEALYYEMVAGQGAYHEYMDVTNNALGYRAPIYRYDLTNPDPIFDGVCYDKGAWVVHMLRHIVGDELFREILAEYRLRHEYGNATTEDFQNVCEDITGQEFGWFFQEWIYEPWHPEYYWGWHIESVVGNEYHIKGFIDQIQELGPVFTMPLDMGIVTSGGDTLYETFFTDEQSEIFQLTVDEEPVELLLDPFNWVLKEAQGIVTPRMNYSAHDIHDDGDGDGRPDPGESVELTLEIFNSGVSTYELSATLSTDDPDVTVTVGRIDYGDVAHNQSLVNDQVPFLLNIDPSAETHLTKFGLTFSTQNGYTDVDSFYLTIGEPTLLLVDDDGTDSYERMYQQSLAHDAVPFQVWDISRQGTPDDTLTDFEMVVWSTGRTRENTLTPNDQAALSSYLDRDGRLFLSGQDIGYDLVGMSNGVDFYMNYLHAEFLEDVSPEGFLQGVAGDPITGTLSLSLISQTVKSPDVIGPRAGANTALLYSPSRATAGIKYGGDYRLVYFAVGLEGIDAITGDSGPVRETLMSNIIQWLQFVPSKGDVNEDGAINILDVVWAINIILGSIDPGPSQYWSADFDDNGSVDVLDAIKIVNEILGPRVMENVHDTEKNKRRIVIKTEADEPLAGVQLKFTFDPEKCIPTTPLVKGEEIEIGASIRENEMSILLYSLDGTLIPEEGTIAEIPLSILDDRGSMAHIWLQETTLAGVDGQEISGKVHAIQSKEASQLPTGFELFQNIPNPFNPETEIRFGIPQGYDDGLSVVLTVYNVLGQKVRTLVQGKLEAGSYTVRWDGLNNEAQPVASGLYFYMLETSDFRAMKRMVLLK